jgi:DNA repair protein SbcD/Mre11
MNILHTADWHIGAELNTVSLDPDFIQFRNWLVHDCIPNHQIEILLISGDIFDKANPASSSRVLYYETLRMLLSSGLKQVILTGGNHDSPLTLNAPADLLKLLSIKVTGGVPENLQELLFVYPQDSPQIAILSVPFLRDGDIRQALAGESSASREESVQQGIQQFFHQAGELALPLKLSGIPVIAMGHLFATGAQTSDSERSIQVGNLGGVDESAFPAEYFDFVALGHIHRPQWVGKSGRIRYSGSPIALSYSEREQQKMVIKLRIVNAQIIPEEISVPQFRKLIRIQGSYAEVQQKLSKITHAHELPALIEVRVEEANYDPAILREMAAWIEIETQNRSDIRITRHQFQVVTDSMANNTSHPEMKRLEEWKPLEVFETLLSDKNVGEEVKAGLRQTFLELLETVQEAEV